MSLPQSRRQFLGAGLTALGASALSSAVAADLPSAPTPKSHVNPFVYHFNLGAIEAWSISDGHMLFNDRVDKMWPPEQRPAMLQALAGRSDGSAWACFSSLRSTRRIAKQPISDFQFSIGNFQSQWPPTPLRSNAKGCALTH